MVQELPSIKPDHGSSSTDPLRQARRFAVAHDGKATWQVASTLVAAVLVYAAVVSATRVPAVFGALLFAPLLVRVFVLQHDCGHGSFSSSARRNNQLGLALSWLTGVPYDPWRTEHHWHHMNQGRLSKRRIDRVNSPMTVAEAQADPEAARLRRRLISAPTVFVLGAWSLLVKRKRLPGFFHFRPGFPDRVPDRAAQRRGLLATVGPNLALHVTLLTTLGARAWLVYALGNVFGGGIGALLFWVQHNFEHTHHADDPDWRFADVALQGSSYLRLGPLATWLTGSIGLHHVHHLNPRIPNYRLEEARRGIPALAARPPLSLRDVRRSFTHVFWDPQAHRMVDLEALPGDPPTSPDTSP